MACCLSPSCCPTRRPAGGRTKRIRPITAAQPPALPSGELQCIKLVPPAPPVEHILETLKPKEIVADIVTRDINTNVTSSATTGEVNDFMAAFFKNCTEIARNNQEALHRALILDDSDRLLRAGQQQTQRLGDDFTLSLTSLSSSPSSFVGQPLPQRPPQSPTAPSVEAASCRTSCRNRLEYHDANEADVMTSLGTSCCSSTVGVNHAPMAAFIAPTNSPVSSSPGTPSSERRGVHSTTTEATPRSMVAPSDCRLSTGAKNSASSRTRSCKSRYRHLPDMTSPRSRRVHCAPVTTPRYLSGLGSRPPCLGQECSPIRTTPCGAGTTGFEPTPVDDLRRFHYHYYLGHAAAMSASCDKDQAIDPPAPVVQRSCQKVDRWLRRLEYCSDDDDDVTTTPYRSNTVSASPNVDINVDERTVGDVAHPPRTRFRGSKRKMFNDDVEPTSCTPSSRQEVVVSGSPHSSARRKIRRRRRCHPRIVDYPFRRRSLATSNSRKTFSVSRHHVAVGVSVPSSKSLFPTAASSSAANSSGWLADRSSSTVAPSGECSTTRHRPFDDGLGDFRVGNRRRLSDSHEVYRRRQIVARRMRQCVRDVDGCHGNGVCVETLAVL